MSATPPLRHGLRPWAARWSRNIRVGGMSPPSGRACRGHEPCPLGSTHILRGLRAIAHPPRRAVVTIGVFDGVHQAHQQLIRSTIRLARRLRGTSVVLTFDPDPQQVLDPTHAEPALMPLEARVNLLRTLGVDWVLVIPFTRRFARMTARAFIQRILLRRLEARAVIVGETFAFGKERRGDMSLLRALGSSRGIQIVAMRPIRRGGKPISSSRIRRLIARGQLSQAKQLLGRAPALYGIVVRGAGRGRRLGFPTANIRLNPQVLPPQGVYTVLIRTLDHSRTWHGVMNLGVRPTFGPGPLVCEVHILGFSGTLMGQAVSVSLLARLRGERCFPSPEALVRQIHRDLIHAHRIFRTSS